MTEPKRSNALCCEGSPMVARGLCVRCYQSVKAYKNGVSVKKSPEEMERLVSLMEDASRQKREMSDNRFADRLKRANRKRTVANGYHLKTIKWRYGLSEEAYLEMLQKQNNCCAICKSESMLYVDHCHTTGKVRGLICPSCNTMVGFLETRGHLLPSIQEYLQNADDEYEY